MQRKVPCSGNREKASVAGTRSRVEGDRRLRGDGGTL